MQPTPVFAWRIPWTEDLVGYSPWGYKESDTAEQLTVSLFSLATQINYFPLKNYITMFLFIIF